MNGIPEMQLLALCPQRADGSYADLMGHLAALNWDRVFWMSTWHGITPLLTSRLLSLEKNPAAREIVPAFVFKALRNHREEHLSRTLRQTAALAELQQEFDRAGIPVVSWKGVALASHLYGGILLREACDLDFFFRAQDMRTIYAIAQRLGYVAPQFTQERDRYRYSVQHEFQFYRPHDHVGLEFHRQIMTSRFLSWLDAQEYIERATVKHPLGYVQVLLNCPEDLLVSLCAHALKHYWDRMKWSCDIAQFLRVYGSQMRWTVFLDRLEETGQAAVVLLGLAIARELFGCELAPAVAERLREEEQIEELAELVCRNMMSGSAEPLPEKDRENLTALFCPQLSDRLWYIFGPLVSLEYEDLYVSPKNRLFFWCNYPYRVARLLRKHGWRQLLAMTTGHLKLSV